MKEVKIESMGDNIFLFKFATEEEKKRVFMRRPWHFDISLLVLSEPAGIGDIKNKSFTQVYNTPIMYMIRDAIQKFGEKIGML